MDVCAEDNAVGVTVTVGNMKFGVAGVSSIAGGETPSGVEACSVANRSGVGVDVAWRLHPAIKTGMRRSVKASLDLLIVHLD